MYPTSFLSSKFQSKYVSGLLLFCCLALIFVYSAMSVEKAEATELIISASIVADGGIVQPLNQIGDSINGQSVCPQDPSAGCDFADDDGIVRTHDRVRYNFAYQLDNSNSPNLYEADVFIKSELPLGMAWYIVPGFCIQQTSSISGDGIDTPSLMLCQLDPDSVSLEPGASGIATSDQLLFEATVLGQSAHDTVYKMTATIYDSINSNEHTSNQVRVTVSAAPRWDLEKQLQSTLTTDSDGELSYRLEYRFLVQLWDNPEDSNIDLLVGNESAKNFTWTEEVENISQNAHILGCYIGGESSNLLPYSRITDRRLPERSFSKGGKVSCTQSAPGEPITIQVTGVDASLNHLPTHTSSGTLLPEETRMVTGGVLRILVPAADVAETGSLSTTSCSENFNLSTRSNQSNFGSGTELLSNNCVDATLSVNNSSWTMFLTKDTDSWSSKVPGTASSTRAGDGHVAPNETFAMAQRIGNNSDYRFRNVQMCAVLDANTFAPYNIELGHAVDLETRNSDLTSYRGAITVEYASGYVNEIWLPTELPASESVIDECADEEGPWYTNSDELPGGPNAVTRVRVTLAKPLRPGKSFAWWLANSTKDNGNANGTILPIFASYRANEINGGEWHTCDYEPKTFSESHVNANPCGDRLILSRGIARIDLETALDDQINAVALGGSVGFVLKPSFSSNGQLYQSKAKIETQLPIGFTYITGSAFQNGELLEPAISVDEMGQQTLYWSLGTIRTDEPIDAIEFDLRAAVTLLDGEQLTVHAEIISAADNSLSDKRTDSREIIASVPEGLSVGTVVHTPIVLPGEPISYTVTIANNVGLPLDETLDYINIFPHNGDNRLPGSKRSGKMILKELKMKSEDVVVYYSSDSPNSMNLDPKDGKNDFATGSTRWCLGIGASNATNGSKNQCPKKLKDITAIRMIDNETLERGEHTEFTVVLEAKNNKTENVYTHDTSASAAEVTYTANSNDSSAVVRASSIEDYVWYDINGNGSQDDDEPGIADAEVRLFGKNKKNKWVSLLAVTNAAGFYSFDYSGGLAPGVYTVTVDSLPDLIKPTIDLDDGITADTQTINSSGSFVLNSGESKQDVSFGYQPYGQISGTAWKDLDGDGLRSVDEPSLANVLVALCQSLGSNPAGASQQFTSCLDGKITKTNEDGEYQFAETGLGEYFVEFIGVDELVHTAANGGDGAIFGQSEQGDVITSDADPENGRTPDVLVSLTDPFVTLNAGYVQPASIRSFIWNDGNHEVSNGTFDESDKPAHGITVLLLDASGNEIARQTTDSEGFYSFTSLRPGTYAVQVLPLWNYEFMPPQQRSAETEQAVNMIQADGTTEPFTLQPGTHLEDVGTVALINRPGILLPLVIQ